MSDGVYLPEDRSVSTAGHRNSHNFYGLSAVNRGRPLAQAEGMMPSFLRPRGVYLPKWAVPLWLLAGALTWAFCRYVQFIRELDK